MPPDAFRRAGHELVDWIADYLANIGERPVQSAIKPRQIFDAIPAAAPDHGEPWDDIWRDFQSTIMPGITHWQHPNFYAFFPCNSSGPAILGELLSAGLGINGFLWQCSPAITELEMRTMDWLGQLIGLPESFLFGEAGPRASGGGIIHGTASEAVLTAMVAARQRTPASASLVAYTSTQAHSSVIKAAMVSGIGRENVRLIPTDATLAMRPDALADQIARDRAAGHAPFFICATIGTTSTGAIDPLPAIGDIARDQDLWLHVDAAYAGAACICPEHRGLIEGVDLADSFNFNPHKWLLTNFDCSAFWTRHKQALIEALNITPAYLRNKASESGDVVDYRDWQVPLGRRFRAVKLWFVLRSYGAEGLRSYIREHVRLGALFEELVRADDRFEMPTPRLLSLVCFRLKGPDEATRTLLERLNATGRAWLTPTVVPIASPSGAVTDRYLIRMAIGATTTREHHVRETWDLIRSLVA